MDSPILLSASVTIGQGQQLEISDPTALTNPSRNAMLLDEIRIRVLEIQEPLLIRAQFRLGRVPLTNGFVPIGCFGKSLLPGDATQFTWKLPRPMYIPPGEFLAAQFQYASDVVAAFPSASPVVQVLYCGRSLASDFPRPAEIDVPWVAAFIPPPRASGVADYIDVSTESDLVNPFDVPVKVQRFIGFFFGSASSVKEAVGFADLTGAAYMTVRAADSRGRIMVRDSTPFSHLFSHIDKSWDVNTVLEPHGFYLFQLDRAYSTYTALSKLQACISMVGSRKVQL